MKKLTCKDLGGSCNHEITGESFEEIGEKSKAHVMEQVTHGDEGHIAAVEQMKNANSEQRQSMMEEFKRRYEEAPEV